MTLQDFNNYKFSSKTEALVAHDRIWRRVDIIDFTKMELGIDGYEKWVSILDIKELRG